VGPDETWVPVISPVDGTLVKGWFASSCGAIMKNDGTIDRGTPRTGKDKGMFQMTFPFGRGHLVHRVTCTSFHGHRDTDLWCVDHILTRSHHPDEQFPGRSSNLRWLPKHKELAARVGLPTNAARKDGEPWRFDQYKLVAAEKNGIPYWIRQVGTKGWTFVRS